MNKKFWLLTILLTLALMMLLGCAQQTPTENAPPVPGSIPSPTSGSTVKPSEDTLLAVTEYAVFTDTTGKFNVEYPKGWFIDSVSGDDANDLHLYLLMEPGKSWEEEIDLGFTYYFSRSDDAKYFAKQWAELAGDDLISITGPENIGNLSYWEIKQVIGETVSALIECDWEDGLLHLYYGYPLDSLSEKQVSNLRSYALHILSTFRINGERISARVLNVYELINEHRKLNSLHPLELNDYISELAREHCRKQSMLNPIGGKQLGISHAGFDERAERIFANLGASAAGENVAIGYDSSEELVDAWLSSPEHRENIMNPVFRRTGIGIVGSVATQIFSD